MHVFHETQISDDLINEIVALYTKNHSIKNIERAKDMFHNEVVSVLYKSGIPLELFESQIPSLKLDNKKLIFSSDYHIGSWQERLEYAEYLNSYALDRGVRDIFILGDFFHGIMHKILFELQTPEELLSYACEKYPYNKNIIKHILFGNHEYEILKNNPELINILKKRDDFDLLGFRETIIRWKGQLIYISHNIDTFQLPYPCLDNILFKIEGHHHYTGVSDGTLYLPPMCDLFTKHAGNVLPGFVLVQSHGDSFCISLSEIYNGKIHDQGLLQKIKHLKKH